MTLSVGEAAFQPEFASAILKECHKYGIHTALETCGYLPWTDIEPLVKESDLVLFNIDQVDSVAHKKASGRDNAIILENASRVSQITKMKVRVSLKRIWIKYSTHFSAHAFTGADLDLLSARKLSTCIKVR